MLFAGSNSPDDGGAPSAGSSANTFVKISDNVFVTVRSISLAGNSQRLGGNPVNRTIELSFPSDTSTLGTRWMNLDQRFTLHLQASEQQPAGSLQDSSTGASTDPSQGRLANSISCIGFAKLQCRHELAIAGNSLARCGGGGGGARTFFRW